MKEFLLQNYRLVIYIGFALLDLVGAFFFACLSIIITLSKKAKMPILSKVLEVLPEYIKQAENSGLTGAEKKSLVLGAAKAFYKKLAGEVTDDIVKELDSAIEDILSTPQKK